MVFFLSFLSSTSASTYLTEFEVLNGILSIPFTEKNNIYTVYLDDNASQLDFRYELEDKEAKVEVVGNNYQENQENIMIIKVTKEKEAQEYKFYLEKETSANVALDNTLKTDLSISKEKEIPYLKEIIVISYCLIIIILFKLLILNFFQKRKKK